MAFEVDGNTGRGRSSRYTRRRKHCPILFPVRRRVVRCAPQRERRILQERNTEKNRGELGRGSQGRDRTAAGAE